MKLSLVVQTVGTQEGKSIEVKLSQFVIGRDPQCHLRPASPMISKRHCALIQREGKAYLQDFGSTNGTVINDLPVQGEVELKDGDRLKIGPLQFVVRVDAQPSKPNATNPTNAVHPASANESMTGANPSDSTTGSKPSSASSATPAASGSKKPTNATPATTSTATPAATPTAKTASTSSAPTKADPAKTDPGKSAKSAKVSQPQAQAQVGEEDDIAAMLLSLQEGSNESPTNAAIPEGSTEMELPAVKEEDKEAAKPADDKSKKKKEYGDTRSAAASILEKMMRRPRT